MSAYIDLRDVRLTGHVSQGLIVLVTAMSVWGTVNDWQGGSPTWSFIAQLLMVPAAVGFIVWFRNVTHNAEAIALHGVRLMADVWRASDPGQREVPFKERTTSPLIRPWQYTFLAMVLFDLLETLMLDGPAYVVFSTLSTVCAVGAAGFACFLIWRVSAMQQRFAVPQSRGRRG
ncbi:hypothetical protein ACIA8G_41220 [Lentzea sp. NPDC051213]|uniref:hypothetical protein n=1 Tax=Lentzea sp. NPDC051213 TaxID=3364126 RepID=UPI0037A67E6C